MPYNYQGFRFAGEYWDAETGTYYLRARNFNPRTGRFTQPDPHWNIGNMIFGDSPTMRNGRMMPNRNSIMQASNLFVYCINNPVKWNDPDGTFIINAIQMAFIVRTTTTVAMAHTLGTSVGAPSGNDAIRTGFDVIETRRLLYRYGIVQPYTRFRTFRGAVYAWARTYFPKSGPTDRVEHGYRGSEWGTWLFRDDAIGRYMFGARAEDKHRGWNTVNIWTINKTYTVVGWIHTHPNDGRYVSRVLGHGERFTYADGRVTLSVGAPGFVVTPRGVVRKIDTSWTDTPDTARHTLIEHGTQGVTNFMNLEHILRLM
ncbi:MAG: RHS repeat-associated core domain-containing protein [Bacteroidetes bacterium]|nr:RHS repeat-associated core domain-containing protein [Bacteroidota bacterium]